MVPPNPKEFDKTALIGFCTAALGARSIFVSTDGFSRLMVGGAILSRMASSENTASTAPAAPSKCPIADLVDDMVTPGEESAGEGDLVAQGEGGVIRLSRRLINATRLLGVLGLGDAAHQRLHNTDDPPPFGLEPLGGRLCWFLDHGACKGETR